MSRKTIFITFPIILLIGIYFIGPSPDRPEFSNVMPQVPGEAIALEKYIANGESHHAIKPDNEARIVWADSAHKKTPYSIVYLHGYGASQGEGEPTHRDFAKKFGCNLYLSRLSDQGIDTVENMLLITPDRLWESSKEALAIGKAIGDKVIIMSTSTGGTLALMLASEFPEDVDALISLSPNIAVRHPLGFIANNPWGLQIARLVVGGKYVPGNIKPGVDKKLKDKYWYPTYRLEAVSELEELLEDKMTRETFSKVKQPSLILYYYKNDAEQDETVSVPAIIKMNSELGTPDEMKEIFAIPGAGDHVIGCYITSKDVPAVENAVDKFAVEKLKLKAD